MLSKVPLLGDPAERFLAQLKEAAKAGLHGGMLFEDLGFRYFGPIDGHNIGLLRKYLRMAQATDGPILLHVVTEKGHGFKPAAEDPVLFHAPPQFERQADAVVRMRSGGSRTFTHVAAEAIFDQMTADPRVTVITAAMCQGNKLEKVRETFPDRFFDTGICEGHAVAFAAGQAKAGLRPIVDIYSTFLQRSYDQIFQEVALQNLPVTFMLDRGGLAGPDGPTHHGVFDLGYLRVLPEHGGHGSRRRSRPPAMLALALRHDGPCAIRYPKAAATTIALERTPVEFGKSEVLSTGDDGTIICGGALLPDCLAAASELRGEGLSIGVINARFLKPLDAETIVHAIRTSSFVVTVEEGGADGRLRLGRARSRVRRRRRHQPRPPPRHPRPLHRTRRARRTAGRPRPRRRRHRRHRKTGTCSILFGPGLARMRPQLGSKGLLRGPVTSLQSDPGDALLGQNITSAPPTWNHTESTSIGVSERTASTAAHSAVRCMLLFGGAHALIAPARPRCPWTVTKRIEPTDPEKKGAPPDELASRTTTASLPPQPSPNSHARP